jgi:hypothetical protein
VGRKGADKNDRFSSFSIARVLAYPHDIDKPLPIRRQTRYASSSFKELTSYSMAQMRPSDERFADVVQTHSGWPNAPLLDSCTKR